MKLFIRIAAGTALAAGMALSAAAADLKVGLVTALSGPTSSIGLPYSKGMNAALAYKPEIAGHKVQLIVLDDASDPATAGRNARKLIEEDKVDIIIGSAGVPSSLAIAAVAQESKVPMIALTPIGLAGLVLGRAASARETACACTTGGNRCRFEARIDSPLPAAAPVPAHPQEMKS